MVGMVLVTHGDVAACMLNSAAMIIGDLKGIQGVGFQEKDSVEDLMERIRSAVDEVDTGEGALILVDLFGGTPFNASARMLSDAPAGKFEVITGMNLPMLLEAVTQRSGKDVEGLAAIAEEAGKSGVRLLTAELEFG